MNNLNIHSVFNKVLTESIKPKKETLQESAAEAAIETAAKTGALSKISNLLTGAKDAIINNYKKTLDLPDAFKNRNKLPQGIGINKDGYSKEEIDTILAPNRDRLKDDAIAAAKLGTPLLGTAGVAGTAAALSGDDNPIEQVKDDVVNYISAHPGIAGGALAAALASGAGALYLRKKLKEQRS